MAERAEINVELIRREVNAFLDAAPYGAANLLADEAGVSASTLSLFRTGKYRQIQGNDRKVALRLLRAFRQREAITEALRGNFTVAWLVHRARRGVDLVRSRRKLAAIEEQEPEAHIVQVLCGRAARDVYFLEANLETESGGLRKAQSSQGDDDPGSRDGEPEPAEPGAGDDRA